jgi:hypothetical protein
MKIHEFDPISFLAGLVIAGIGLTFLLLPDLGNIIDFFTDARAWLWPVVLIAIGVAILLPVVTRSGDTGEQVYPVDDVSDV